MQNRLANKKMIRKPGRTLVIKSDEQIVPESLVGLLSSTNNQNEEKCDSCLS